MTVEDFFFYKAIVKPVFHALFICTFKHRNRFDMPRAPPANPLPTRDHS